MSKKKKEGLRYPPLNNLISHVHNKYELVLATSKRARQIVDGDPPYIMSDIENPISIATEEIDEGLIEFDNPVLDGTDIPEESEDLLDLIENEVSKALDDIETVDSNTQGNDQNEILVEESMENESDVSPEAETEVESEDISESEQETSAEVKTDETTAE